MSPGFLRGPEFPSDPQKHFQFFSLGICKPATLQRLTLERTFSVLDSGEDDEDRPDPEAQRAIIRPDFPTPD